MSEIKEFLSPWDLGGFGVFVIAMTLIIVGYRIVSSKEKSDIKDRYGLQIVGLTFLVPIILVVSIVLDLNDQAITALLGTIIGYFFGSSVKTQDASER